MGLLGKISDFFSFNFSPRYIITGGPGVGKTSIIDHLQKCGYGTIHEAAKDAIRYQLERGVQNPWEKEGFDEMVLQLQQKRQQEAGAFKTSSVFFDRSPVDTWSYRKTCPQMPQEEFQKTVEQLVRQKFYNKTVFLIENLGFCKQEDFRPETQAQSMEIEKRLERAYKALGFRVVRIPCMSIEKRVEMILSHIWAPKKLKHNSVERVAITA